MGEADDGKVLLDKNGKARYNQCDSHDSCKLFASKPHTSILQVEEETRKPRTPSINLHLTENCGSEAIGMIRKIRGLS